jgi:hypothetical protein
LIVWWGGAKLISSQIVSQNLSIAEAAYWLLLIWEASEAEERVKAIYRLPWPTP